MIVKEESIFGRTQAGVPNPNVPHTHPWPTRYHGPNWTSPDTANRTYVQRPYARPGYMGLGVAPIFNHVTGSGLFDAAIGGAIGFLATSRDQDKALWAIVGGLAGYAAGTAGLLGLGGALYLKHKK